MKKPCPRLWFKNTDDVKGRLYHSLANEIHTFGEGESMYSFEKVKVCILLGKVRVCILLELVSVCIFSILYT